VPSALDTAIASLDLEHQNALRWFADHAGEFGSRPWRKHGRSIIPGVEIPVVAQRGIHVPENWRYAVSINVTLGTQYRDGDLLHQEDGTWVLAYRAHRGKQGSGSKSHWNSGLLNNFTDRVPVGVFAEKRKSKYDHLGLALVDSYDPETETFMLHGPVSAELDPRLFELDIDLEPVQTWPAFLLEELRTDYRTHAQALVVRREQQGAFRDQLLHNYQTCAVTSYDAPESLEAAHIIPFRGPASHRPDNGLLLRADIHVLFDRHLIAVEPVRRIVRTSPAIRDSKYAEYEGRQLHVPEDPTLQPRDDALALHFEVFAGVH